jgi:hypothetical protein
MFDEIDWRNVEIGKQYMLEDKYYFQAEVTILKQILHPEQPDYVEYEFRVDKAYTGCKDGDVTNFARIVEGQGMYLVSGMKFKPLGNMFDYCTPNYNPYKKQI